MSLTHPPPIDVGDTGDGVRAPAAPAAPAAPSPVAAPVPASSPAVLVEMGDVKQFFTAVAGGPAEVTSPPATPVTSATPDTPSKSKLSEFMESVGKTKAQTNKAPEGGEAESDSAGDGGGGGSKVTEFMSSVAATSVC